MDWPVKFIQVFLLYRPSTFAHVASRISAQVSRCPVAASTMDWLVKSFQVLRSLMDPLVGATQPVSQDDRSTPLFICCCCSYIQHRYSYLLICILWLWFAENGFNAKFCKKKRWKGIRYNIFKKNWEKIFFFCKTVVCDNLQKINVNQAHLRRCKINIWCTNLICILFNDGTYQSIMNCRLRVGVICWYNNSYMCSYNNRMCECLSWCVSVSLCSMMQHIRLLWIAGWGRVCCVLC